MCVVSGVDGCKRGWICVSLDLSTGEISARVFEDAESLFAGVSFSVMGIDIPIGIPDVDPRTCDQAARKLLGPRGASVFPVPVRAALEATSYDAACEASEKQCGRRLPQQSYAILPKIREVDTALRASAALQERVFEVHPELSFRQWNGGQPMAHPKRSGFGFLERLELVRGEFGNAADRIREEFPLAAVADDDILDAIAVLWTARRISEGTAMTVPAEPVERDGRGLPMVMLA